MYAGEALDALPAPHRTAVFAEPDIAFRADFPELIITLGEKDCRVFEKYRHQFPRDGILWTYDYFGGGGRQRTLHYELSERWLWPHYLRIIELKAN